MTTPDLSAVTARRIGRDYADAMAEIWLWGWPHLTPGEWLNVKNGIMQALGIAWEHRKRKEARATLDVAMAAFTLRMDARRRSLDTQRSVEQGR